MDQPRQVNQTLITIIVVVVLAGVTAGIVYFGKSGANSDSVAINNSSTTASASQSNTTPSSTTSTSSYKDGSYQVTGSYETPGGTESISVSATISGNVVTDVTVSQNANNRDSEYYQSQFASEFKSAVVGKSVNSISLSRVAGSSLTSNGFNDALDMIKQDAKA
ncbi:MAG: hypothetical protein ABIQ04_03660 [Candidatus Saccharimonadales bacterium]